MRSLLLFVASVALLGAGPLDGLARIGPSAGAASAASPTALHAAGTRGAPAGAERQMLPGPSSLRATLAMSTPGALSVTDGFPPRAGRGLAPAATVSAGLPVATGAPVRSSAGTAASRAPPGTTSTDASLPARP